MIGLAAAAMLAGTAPDEVALLIFEAFNRHDIAALTSLYDEDAEIVSSDACGTQRGRAAVAASHAAIFAAFPDGRDEVTAMIVRGDRVAVEFTFTGPTDGRAVRIPIASFLTVRGGKVVRDATYFDADPSPDCPPTPRPS